MWGDQFFSVSQRGGGRIFFYVYKGGTSHHDEPPPGKMVASLGLIYIAQLFKQGQFYYGIVSFE